MAEITHSLTTTVLINNIHCASCALHIQSTLSEFGSAIQKVNISVVSHEVRVLHNSSVKTSDLCRTLIEAAFEVNSALTKDEQGRIIVQLDYPTDSHGWFAAAADFLRQPLHASTTPKSSSLIQADKIKWKRKHVENCDACRTEEKLHDEKSVRSPGMRFQEEGFLKKSLYEYLDDGDSGGEIREADSNGLDVNNPSDKVHRFEPPTNNALRKQEHLYLPSSAAASKVIRHHSSTSVPVGKEERYNLVLSIEGMTCASCTNAINEALQGLYPVKTVNVDIMTSSATVEFTGSSSFVNTILDVIQEIGYEAAVFTCDILTSVNSTGVDLDPAALRYKAIFSIGGMTCVSCSNAVTEGLRELPFVHTVEITLMTNSGIVTFTGQENLDEIMQKVDDLGYECSVDRWEVIRSSTENTIQPVTKLRRCVELTINGMFCEHCPPRILEVLSSKFSDRLEIVQMPSLKLPILKVSYEPSLPDFTIRDIISTMGSVNESFKISIYHPPSIEDRSRVMRVQEQKRIFQRLVLSSIVAVPTLLIGVIWMDLVPSTNHLRSFFEEPIGTGNVTRAEWALFVLATPVMFFAADTFHMRAIKEIRALWRKGSKVPVRRRFYRFGSMNLLVSAGTSVAYLASLALLIIDATTPGGTSNSTTYFDSVVFLTFFILIGRYLEAYTKSKTGDAVGMLGKLRPQNALLTTSSEPIEQEKQGSVLAQEPLSITTTKEIQADMLEIGDTVIVARGSSPPADGIIVTGVAQFDESSLTGESKSIKKGPGEKVFIGTINTGDSITVEVTEVGGSSMLDQIVSVVREGQTKRAPVERIAELLTGYFVPIITGLAIVTFFIWFSLGQSGALPSRYIDGQAGGWAFWSLEFAIAVFVVACPCGLGLAAPTALFVGGGLAAKHGILVRGGGEAFEQAGSLDAIVFDKTGTLTEGGDLRVTDHEMYVQEEEADVAWAIAGALEEQSSHPIARAIVALVSRQRSKKVSTRTITEEPGQGMRGVFTTLSSADSQTITYEGALGSESLISSLEPPIPTQDYFFSQTLSAWKSQSKSIAVLAIRRLSHVPSLEVMPSTTWTMTALFATSDPIRPSALPMIQNLQARGLSVYMLTGDNPQTAASVASSLDIPIANVFAGILPIEKAAKIQWLQKHAPRRQISSTLSGASFIPRRKQKSGREAEQHNVKVGFVGDGINDAPALTAATLSISLSTGSPIALSASSFILLSPSLLTIPTLLDLSSRVFRRIKFNFAWALIYNLVLIPVAAGVFFGVREDGWRLGPVWASAAMAASSVSVVCCSLLLRWEGDWKFWKRGR